MNKESFYQEALGLKQQCIEDRRFLHAHPETGFDLPETFDYIWKRLKEMGVTPAKCGRRGITCTTGKPGRTILLRADMDALPMREETGLPFAAQGNCMHACGHDMHAAMLLTAAQLIKSHEAELPGTVKLMFQPAEELLEGAKDMIAAGVLENPRVDAALMFHVMTAQTIPVGTVIIPAPGVSAPAAGTFSIRIQGKGSHGAMPHAGIDPITAATHTVIALQEITARELAPADNAVLTIGTLQAGNTANAIPDTALLRGSFRAFDDNAFDLIRRRVEEIAISIARAFRAGAQVEFHGNCPTLVNNATLAGQVEAHLCELLGREKVFNASKLAGSSAARSSGSEDFASVSHQVPSLMLALVAGHPDDGYAQPLHHPQADFDERALIPGAAAYAWLALKWLETAK